MGLQPPTPEQRAQALADIAAAEAAQAAEAAPAQAVEAQSAAPVALTPAPAPSQAISASTPRKATLVGMAPDAMQRPAAPRPAAATTQHGFSAPFAVRPDLRTPEALPSEPPRSVAASADAPTPIEVPIGGAESTRLRAATEAGKQAPTGVAKAYHGKVDSAAVVVDAAVMQASEAAAQAAQAQARLRAGRRNINAVTIPGTVRVIPRGAGATPDIEPIDMVGLKPSRTPLVIGALVLLLAGAGAVFVLRGAPHPPHAPVATADITKVQAPPLPAQASAETVAAAPPIQSPDAPASTPAAAPEPSSAASAEPSAANSAPAKPAAARAPAAAPRPAAPVKKTSAPTPKRSASPAGASPSKAKGVIVRDSPF